MQKFAFIAIGRQCKHNAVRGLLNLKNALSIGYQYYLAISRRRSIEIANSGGREGKVQKCLLSVQSGERKKCKIALLLPRKL